MAPKPYFISYRLDHPAVSLPWASDHDFRALADRYNVRFAIVTDAVVQEEVYPGNFLDTGVMPDWIREVHRVNQPPVRIYEIIGER